MKHARTRLTLPSSLLVALAYCLLATGPATAAAERTSFKVAWSIYVGWMPWDYAEQSGILKKWADRYGIRIQLVQVNDYVESINQYTAGGFDACVMTNMDALTIPAAGGVESTALIAGDYSNGNDGVVMKGAGRKLADIRGQKVNLVALSVSHYLLARGLSTVGLRERDLTVVNTSDADIVAAYNVPATTAVVAWKPQLAAILGSPNATLVFDSSKIPGEIVDLMVVNTATLKASPKLGKALVGAWFETLGVMFGKGAPMLSARASMAKASGATPASFDSQLATTHMFTTPADTFEFMSGSTLPATMDLVRNFSFDHGLLGAGARSADAVGMDFPGGRTLGNPRNLRLHFDPSYVKLALDNGL
jgi:NitT/TauT family transport system substrate-binding protein